MTWGISSIEDCIFVAKPLLPKSRASKFNIGGNVNFEDWTFSTLEHKLGRVHLVPGICFEESVNAIVPVKPRILKKPVKLAKGQFVKLG